MERWFLVPFQLCKDVTSQTTVEGWWSGESKAKRVALTCCGKRNSLLEFPECANARGDV